MNLDCIFACLSTIGLLAVVFIMIYSLMNQKCPKCHKKGGVCAYDRREDNGKGKKVYDVLLCKNCGYVISEVLVGEKKVQ